MTYMQRVIRHTKTITVARSRLSYPSGNDVRPLEGFPLFVSDSLFGYTMVRVSHILNRSLLRSANGYPLSTTYRRVKASIAADPSL